MYSTNRGEVITANVKETRAAISTLIRRRAVKISVSLAPTGRAVIGMPWGQRRDIRSGESEAHARLRHFLEGKKHIGKKQAVQ